MPKFGRLSSTRIFPGDGGQKEGGGVSLHNGQKELTSQHANACKLGQRLRTPSLFV